MTDSRSRLWSAARLVLVPALAIGVAALLAGAASRTAGAAAPSAFVRVNQVGYPAGATKRAYAMSNVDLAGGTFAVKQGGTTVFSAPIGASIGSWSRTYSFVHPLDFDGVIAAGSYSVEVSGAAAATSPTFAIGNGPSVYGQALANALSFYETERDGPNFIANALRTAPAHVNDQTAKVYETPHVNSAGRFSGDLTPTGRQVDASGSWWDAGDYIKGVQTLGYATAMLLHGVRELPTYLGPGSATANFTAESKFGTDWLLRMWDDDSRTFHFQVGIGTGNAKTVGDHDFWRLPQVDDTFGGTDPLYRYIRNRPVFRVGPPGSLISPNLAGRDAAVFGLCFQIFKSSDPSFANRC